MSTLRLLSRVIVGITFIFSGFVKGVDPLGTMYKIEDYLIAYQMDWALDLALPAAFALVLLEFLLGVFILLNIRLKLTTWLLTGMMAFFTLVTLYDALYNPVPDCGCFGEAIKLTNWETFYKNVVLMVLTIIIVVTKPTRKALTTTRVKAYAGISAAVLFFAFSWYSYQHLPPVDFREWKVGNDMKQEGEPVYYLIYENKETGEQKQYLSSELPWSDTAWVNRWEFVEQKVDYSSVVKPHNLEIVNMENGSDMTQEVIETKGWQFLVTSHSLPEADKEGLEKVVQLYEALSGEGYQFAVLTASLEEEVERIRKQYGMEIPVYQADDIELKAMVRANPGLILLRNGVVISKWHYNDFPEAKQIVKKYD